MGGWLDGEWMDGWVDGWMGGWMVGWVLPKYLARTAGGEGCFWKILRNMVLGGWMVVVVF